MVAAGGALGAMARVEVTHLVPDGTGFPWGTFLVNVTGSFMLGAVMVVVLERLSPNRLVRPFLGSGVCGAYTTFSAVAVQTDVLVHHGRAGVGVGYVVASVGAGLVAIIAGGLAARAVLPRDPRPGGERWN